MVETAKPGVSVLSLCEKGDAYIMAETGKVFKKEKEMKKGEAKTMLVSLLFGRTEVDSSRRVYMQSQVHATLISFNNSRDFKTKSNVVAEYDSASFFWVIQVSLPPPLLSVLAKLVDDFQMKTWWFSFPSSRHCLSHQRLSQ